MADLTTISSTTFVELVFSELCFSLVPRVVVFIAQCNFLVLFFVIRTARLQRTFKVCFCILKMSSISYTAKSTFTSVTSKIVVTAMTDLTNTAVRTFVRWHRYRCLTHVMSSSGTTISWNMYGSRAPQTILSNLILQSKQRVILVRMSIGH